MFELQIASLILASFTLGYAVAWAIHGRQSNG